MSVTNQVLLTSNNSATPVAKYMSRVQDSDHDSNLISYDCPAVTMVANVGDLYVIFINTHLSCSMQLPSGYGLTERCDSGRLHIYTATADQTNINQTLIFTANSEIRSSYLVCRFESASFGALSSYTGSAPPSAPSVYISKPNSLNLVYFLCSDSVQIEMSPLRDTVTYRYGDAEEIASYELSCNAVGVGNTSAITANTGYNMYGIQIAINSN